MKANMFFYAASVVSFYLSVAMLFVNSASVLGLSLVCMGLISLALGVICQIVSAHHDKLAGCACGEAAAASL